MDILQKSLIQESIRDVLSIILDATPVKEDIIPQITVAKINRGPVAHLSIERAIKALVKDSGGTVAKSHALCPNFQELKDCDSYAAEFLEAAFNDTVGFYRFNPNTKGFTHLKSLAAYLSTAGSERAFNAMRYWELEHPLDAEIISKVSLLIHFELLAALCQLFIPGMHLCTVIHRVENIVTEALFNGRGAELAYPPGSTKEAEVYSYLEWLKGFPNWREALAEAKKRKFEVGNATANSVLASAYRSLVQVNDPAVRYYLGALDILPPQQRDYIPEVEWLGPTPFQRGAVKSPAGSILGSIEKRADGVWNVIPLVAASIPVQATAETQTDARAWLADLLMHPVVVAVGGNRRELRLVGEVRRLLLKPSGWLSRDYVPPESYTWNLEFWDENHGLESGDEVVVEFRENPSNPIIRVVRGTVLSVDRWKVAVNDNSYFDVAIENSPENTAESD